MGRTKHVGLCRDGAARRLAKNRCEVQYSASNNYGMELLQSAELDPQLYVALALDFMSDVPRPKGQFNRRMDRFCTYPAGKGGWSFASLFSEPGIFTTDRDAMREDLVAHDLVNADAVAHIDLEAKLRCIPAYRFPGMGKEPFFWTPHLRARFWR